MRDWLEGRSAGTPQVAELTSLLELHVVRGILEPETARLAVIHMSPRDIASLGQIVARMDRIDTNALDFARAQEDFSMMLATGTRNPLLIALFGQIVGVRRQPHWIAHKERTLSPQRIREYRARYRSLHEAIVRRDIESAIEYVKLQLVDEQRRLMAET